MRILALALATAIACGGAAASPESRTLDHQGVPRGYVIANAAHAAKRPRPLVLVLHGRREANEPNRSSPALDALAAREGFVAVYPAAIAGAWNYPTRIGGQIPISMAGNVPADDLGFLTSLLDRLIADRVAMSSRVYVSGASMGGFMTFALMCAIPDRIAAAAPLIATMTDRQMEACKPSRQVPVAMLAGTADKLVPYDGHQGGGFRMAAVPETLAFWWGLHGCDGHRAAYVNGPPPKDQPDAISTLRIEATGCRVPGAVRLYRVEGGGHTLPSLRPITADQETRFGPRSTEFETSAEVWAFFKRFAKPDKP